MRLECSNCGSGFPQDQQGALVVRDGGNLVASVCGNCTEGTLVVKVVLRREAANEEFAYDQYAALEVEKKAAIGRR